MSGWTISVRDYWLVWLLITVAVMYLAHFAYRRTIPPVAPHWRKTLFGLRTAALSLLLLVALGLRLNWSGTTERSPRVAVLIDRSESMSFTDPDGSRADAVRGLLAGSGMKRIREDAEVSWLGFAGAVSPVDPARIAFTGDATAIGKALLHQRRKIPAPDHVVLISDGVSNSGPDPVRAAGEIGLPVHVFGVGDPRPQADARISGVSAPRVTISGRPYIVSVTIENTGLPAWKSTLGVRSGGRTIAVQQVTLPPSGARREVKLRLPTGREGVRRFTVLLDTIPGERFPQNNRAVFTTRVFKGQRRVLVVAGAPSPDVAFWMRFFHGLDNWQAGIWLAPYPVRRSRPPLLNADTLRGFDLVIWHDVQPGAVANEALGDLAKWVREGGGLLAIPGRHGLPVALQTVLPVTALPARYTSVLLPAMWTKESMRHPIISSDVDHGTWSLGWSSLPPLRGHDAGLTPESGATTLMTAGGDPLAVAGRHGRGRSLAFGGLSYWRWDMIPRGLGEVGPAGNAFWRAAVRWLSTRQPLDRVQIATDAPLYRLGVPVGLTVRVYDEALNPLDGADVRISVDDGVIAVDAVPEGDGRYTASITGLDPGEHTALARARRGKVDLGTGRTRIDVAAVGLEHEETRQRRSSLEAIARASGGTYVSTDRADSLLLAMNLDRIPEQRESHVNVGSWPGLLWIIIGLFAVEWAGRRVLGLL